MACLALLDLSAAFDTVDHDVLLQRLSITYGIDGIACMWFRSYLSDRFQYVRVRTGLSSTALMRYGVPQGSVLGLILLLLYTANLAKLVESHSPHVNMYADDTQVYNFSSPSSADQLQSVVHVGLYQ